MRANRQPRKKAAPTPLGGAAPNDLSQRWTLRFLLGVLVFGLGTIIAVLVFMYYRDQMPVERARLVIFSIFAMFIAFEICAIGALLTWWYRRRRR
jgi:hypothetical protein